MVYFGLLSVCDVHLTRQILQRATLPAQLQSDMHNATPNTNRETQLAGRSGTVRRSASAVGTSVRRLTARGRVLVCLFVCLFQDVSISEYTNIVDSRC